MHVCQHCRDAFISRSGRGMIDYVVNYNDTNNFRYAIEVMSTCDVDVFSSIAETNPEELKRLILNDLKRPVICKNRIDSWATPQKWSPSSVCSLLHDTTTTFEVCPKQNTLAFTEQFKHNEPVFESQCGHIEATLGNFCEWLDHHPEVKRDSSPPQAKQARIAPVNPLLSYPRSQYWIYADYKYMSQLCPQSELLTAVDWSVFGFPGRDGRESTMWIGSEGASTPCHYDTYGCNLVAQLWGKKRWTLASPTQSRGMYPTRTPYEESSVFSQVNVDSPDLDKYPDFKTVTLHKVSCIVGQPGSHGIGIGCRPCWSLGTCSWFPDNGGTLWSAWSHQ